jgi:hypothetical protein
MIKETKKNNSVNNEVQFVDPAEQAVIDFWKRVKREPPVD